eukprot:Rhum_TRINITY_DN16596_c0_g1::Rhum_TRINITY_DN16596_c0_g1_i1::g.163778::m.163778
MLDLLHLRRVRRDHPDLVVRHTAVLVQLPDRRCDGDSLISVEGGETHPALLSVDVHPRHGLHSTGELVARSRRAHTDVRLAVVEGNTGLQLALVEAPRGEVRNECVHAVLRGQRVELHAGRDQALEQRDHQSGVPRTVAQDGGRKLALIADHHELLGALRDRDHRCRLHHLRCLVHHHKREGAAPQQRHARADARARNHVCLPDAVSLLAASGHLRHHGPRLVDRTLPDAHHLHATPVKGTTEVVCALVGEGRGQHLSLLLTQPPDHDLHGHRRLTRAGRALDEREAALFVDNLVVRRALRHIECCEQVRDKTGGFAWGNVEVRRTSGDSDLRRRVRLGQHRGVRDKGLLVGLRNRLKHRVGDIGAWVDDAHVAIPAVDVRGLLALQRVEEGVHAVVRDGVRTDVDAVRQVARVRQPVVRRGEHNLADRHRVDLSADGDVRIVQVGRVVDRGDEKAAPVPHLAHVRDHATLAGDGHSAHVAPTESDEVVRQHNTHVRTCVSVLHQLSQRLRETLADHLLFLVVLHRKRALPETDVLVHVLLPRLKLLAVAGLVLRLRLHHLRQRLLRHLCGRCSVHDVRLERRRARVCVLHHLIDPLEPLRQLRRRHEDRRERFRRTKVHLKRSLLHKNVGEEGLAAQLCRYREGILRDLVFVDHETDDVAFEVEQRCHNVALSERLPVLRVVSSVRARAGAAEPKRLEVHSELDRRVHSRPPQSDVSTGLVHKGEGCPSLGHSTVRPHTDPRLFALHPSRPHQRAANVAEAFIRIRWVKRQVPLPGGKRRQRTIPRDAGWRAGASLAFAFAALSASSTALPTTP